MQPRLRPALLLTAALALSGMVAPDADDSSTPDLNGAPSKTDASRVVCSCTTTGEHTLIVPSGVTSRQVATGGGADTRSTGVIRPAGGGEGGEVTGTAEVPTFFGTLLVEVGGPGMQWVSGGTGFDGAGRSLYGGGGGGASEMRTTSDLWARLTVAGGGCYADYIDDFQA